MTPMSHRTRLIVSIILGVACVAALVTNVPVSLPYAYSYTVTETPRYTVTSTDSSGFIKACLFTSLFDSAITACIYPPPPDNPEDVVPLSGFVTTVTSTGIPYSQVDVATATSTGNAPLFHVVLNSSLQPYACTHLNLTGGALFCMMQFWEPMVVLLIALIALAGLLVYSFVKRRKAQASKLENLRA